MSEFITDDTFIFSGLNSNGLISLDCLLIPKNGLRLYCFLGLFEPVFVCENFRTVNLDLYGEDSISLPETPVINGESETLLSRL